jgi:1,4-alpha-glucan branching enzyme
MKKKLPLIFIAFLCFLHTKSQLLTWTPDFAKETDNIAITMDATKGNQGLLNYVSNVYVHTGVITNLSTGPADWKYSKFAWATANAAALATPAGANKWTFNVTGGIRAFYGVPAGETILRVTMLFRDATGNLVQRNTDGGDMYIPVYDNNLAVRFTAPPLQPKYILTPEPINITAGSTLPVTAIANATANLKLYLNGTTIQTTNSNTTISANPIIASGNQELVVEAITTSPAATKRDTIKFFVAGGVTIAPLPAGVREGINYNSATSATLVLYAPNKARVSVIGDFAGSNWIENATYQMNKTPDGNYWWITINSLTAAQLYSYQYLVNGTIKTGDPYSELVLDPNNDQYITAATFPNLKPYPTGLTTGIVSTLQTSQTPYVWNVPNFSKPDKKGLVIYELLLRDFLAAHDFKTLKDTIGYLKNLGVNTINVMPFNEFDGNESWGYNPSYFFALDKFYGTKNRLKDFIDFAHQNGIAVVMDMVMNHATGDAPQAKMYWNGATNEPSADNPWMNITATHPFSVYNDFNHTSNATKYLVDRVVEHWLTEYKIDGFRWDLSKGFVQNTGGDWQNYNTERINIWKRIYDVMQLKSPNSYCILEHLGDNQEEKELANYGMMTWGKMTDQYNQTSMGFVSGSDISGVIHTARSWTVPHLVGYAESHDEERTMYKNIQFGNVSGGYDVKNLQTALRREELIAATLLTVPGPKMWWQFAELGYDFSINRCGNGTVSNNCRTDSKPIRWDYFQDVNRKRLYNVYASLANLRKLKPQAFIDGTIEWGTSGLVKWIKVTHSSLKLLVVLNMDVAQQTGNITFQNAGTWYSYLLGTTIAGTGASQSVTLLPGEYHVYLDQNINGSIPTPINNIPDPIKNMRVLVFPNPVVKNALIEYDLPENGVVDIGLLNSMGQRVGNIFNGNKLKGTHQIGFQQNGFNIQKLTKGTYYLVISINGKKRVENIQVQ